MKSRMGANLQLAGVTSASMVVLPCSAMFVSNSEELYLPLYDFLVFVVLVGVGFCLLIFSALSLTARTLHFVVVTFFFFLMIAAPVQYYLLSESLVILDGENPVNFGGLEITADLVVYALIGGVVWVLRNGIYKNFMMLGRALCLFQIINLGVLLYFHFETIDAPLREQTDVTEMSRFSKNQNVLHIVLDGFQSNLFQEMIENDGHLASKLEGFVYFPDALTVSEVTQLSFAAFLTGRTYKNSEPMKTYLFNSRLARMGTSTPEKYVPNILDSAAKGGFEVEVATPFILIEDQEFYSRFFRIHLPYRSTGANFREVMLYQASLVLDLTVFRTVPRILKGFVYNGGRWGFSQLVGQGAGLNYNHHAGVQFLKDLADNFELTDASRVYKLVHLLTPHAPFVATSSCEHSGRELEREFENIYNQARCALLGLIPLLDVMKASGVLDSATVLIHADHGIRLPFPGFDARGEDAENYPRPIGNSNPLLLIKPPGRRGDLVTIRSEVSLADIPRTLAELLKLNVAFGGVDFLTHHPKNRVRWYYHSRESRVVAGREDRYRQWNEYEVSGPLSRPSSWKKTGKFKWTREDFGELPVENFLEIDDFEVSDEREIRIRYRGRERHHFVAVGSERRVTRFVGTDLVTARLRPRTDIKDVCIVDTVRGLRQCLR